MVVPNPNKLAMSGFSVTHCDPPPSQPSLRAYIHHRVQKVSTSAFPGALAVLANEMEAEANWGDGGKGFAFPDKRNKGS